MDETESKLDWSDLSVPCKIVVSYKDIPNITQNEPFVLEVQWIALNRDILVNKNNRPFLTKNLNLLEIVPE